MTVRCNAEGRLGPSTGSGEGSNQLAVAGVTFIELLIVIAIIFILATIANMASKSYTLKGDNSAAIADVRVLANEIDAYKATMGSYPTLLSDLKTGKQIDPWGNPYQYVSFAGNPNWHGICRRDRKLNPLNTDYDLYSMGADGKSSKALTAQDSQDDIVRANDGAFIGLGANY